MAASGVSLALTGCSFSDPEPLPLGTFEVVVTGGVQGTATGTARVAEPDSALNVSDMEWVVRLPIVFEPTAGDSVSVYFSIGEPRDPNGPFLEFPEGTFPILLGDLDPAKPVPSLAVRTQGVTVRATEGSATLRRRADGAIEGSVEARYSAPQLGSGPTFRGRLRLRFTVARPAPPL